MNITLDNNMLTFIALLLVIVGVGVIFGYLRKKKEMDKNDSDGTIQPK